MISVNQKIYGLLANILGNKAKVYPGIAKVDAKLPYVVYADNSYASESTKDGDAGDSVYYTMTVVSESFDEADSLSDMIREGLGGVSWIKRTGGEYVYSDKHERTINYTVST